MMKDTRLRYGTLLSAVAVGVIVGCAPSKDDGYLSPPSDPKAVEQAKVAADKELATATYASVGKPFGCDTDCKDEELGFAEARQDGVTKSEDCTTRLSDKSLMTNATQDGCRAYLLEVKDFENRATIATRIEREYLESYFGKNPAVQNYAKQLLYSGQKAVALELNKIVSIMGSSADHNRIIGLIEAKYQPFGDIVRPIRDRDEEEYYKKYPL